MELWLNIRNLNHGVSAKSSGFLNAARSSALTALCFVDSIISSQLIQECSVFVPSTTGVSVVFQKNVTREEVSGWHMKDARMRSRQWSGEENNQQSAKRKKIGFTCMAFQIMSFMLCYIWIIIVFVLPLPQ